MGNTFSKAVKASQKSLGYSTLTSSVRLALRSVQNCNYSSPKKNLLLIRSRLLWTTTSRKRCTRKDRCALSKSLQVMHLAEFALERKLFPGRRLILPQFLMPSSTQQSNPLLTRVPFWIAWIEVSICTMLCKNSILIGMSRNSLPALGMMSRMRVGKSVNATRVSYSLLTLRCISTVFWIALNGLQFSVGFTPCISITFLATIGRLGKDWLVISMRHTVTPCFLGLCSLLLVSSVRWSSFTTDIGKDFSFIQRFMGTFFLKIRIGTLMCMHTLSVPFLFIFGETGQTGFWCSPFTFATAGRLHWYTIRNKLGVLSVLTLVVRRLLLVTFGRRIPLETCMSLITSSVPRCKMLFCGVLHHLNLLLLLCCTMILTATPKPFANLVCDR